jgi:cytochrome c oxidase subunit III
MQQFDSNKQKEKVYSSLVYVGIISSIMLFAGLSSAVLVRKMDKFWVNIHLPKEFLISTILIIISSVFLIMGLKSAKKGLKKNLNRHILIALIFGIGFGVFQFRGWKSYYNNGNAVKSFITYVYGQYGDGFKVYYKNFPIEYDGENYQINENDINQNKLDSVKSFVKEIASKSDFYNGSELIISNYSNPFSFFSVREKEFLKVDEKGLLLFKGKPLSENMKDELFKFTYGLYNDHPFFMLKGDYGKDFSVSLNGEELIYDKKKLFFPERTLTQSERNIINQKVFQGGKEYEIKNGKVFLQGKEVPQFEGNFMFKQDVEIIIVNNNWFRMQEELNSNQYAEFFQTANVSSSFVWVITFIHFVHLLFSLVGLSVVYNRSKKGFYGVENVAGLKAIGVFWHFVGVLWLYLYIFLEFIN